MAIFPLFLSLFLAHADPHSLQLDRIKLPSGFKISVYAKGVDGARSLAWGDQKILFVGTRSEGKVYAIDSKGKSSPSPIT